jgi:hypothetical protein
MKRQIAFPWLIHSLLIFSTVSLAQDTSGKWQYLLGEYDHRAYVYTIAVQAENVIFGGNFNHTKDHILFWDLYPGVKGLGQYNRSGAFFQLGGGVHGPDYEVRAILPVDGAVFVAGQFNVVRDRLARNIAKWNGTDWESLQGGMNYRVLCLAEFQGEIYAGGEFTRVNGQRLAYLARWNGQEWLPVGDPLNGPVHSLTVYDDALYAGGRFTRAGETEINHLAAWKNESWASVGSGVNGNVLAMAVQGNDLIIAGRFERAGTVDANKIARWNGSVFQPVGLGLDGNVYCLAADDGSIYAGGEFTHECGSLVPLNHISCWDGQNWQPLDDGLDEPVYSLALHRYDLYVGGKFKREARFYGLQLPGQTHYHLIRWRNPVPDVPFKRKIEMPFSLYTDGPSSIVWRDADNDGDDDLFITGYDQNLVLRNEAGTFTQEIQGTLIPAQYRSCWADYDNDGDEDIMALGWRYWDDKRFLKNENGIFLEAKDILNWSPTYSAWTGSWGDYNNDGFVDFMVCNVNTFYPLMRQTAYLYTNHRGDHFSVDEAIQIRGTTPFPYNVNWCDFDNDGDIDIFMARGGESEFTYTDGQDIYLNEGGIFSSVGIDVITQEKIAATSGAWGDFDNDGDFDLCVTAGGFQNNGLYENLGNLDFRKVMESPVCTDGGFSLDASWCDYDNDGDLDLFITNRSGGDNFLYENMGHGDLTVRVDNMFTRNLDGCAGMAWYDFDRDGDQDLAIIGDEYSRGQIVLLENTAPANHFLNLKLIGVRSNRDALGAKIHLKTWLDGETVTQTREVNNSTWLSQSSLEQVFGLGNAAVAALIIEWPSGILQILENVKADQFMTVIEDTSSGLQKPAGLSGREMLEWVENEPARDANGIKQPEDVLYACAPNPFNPSTEIRYSIARPSQVRLMVLNARGELVQSLIQSQQPAGHYSIIWSGRDQYGNPAASGLYFCRLECAGFVSTQKMLLVR